MKLTEGTFEQRPVIVPPGDRILDLTQVEMKVNLKRSSIYSHMKSGEFPQLIKTGKRRSGWLCSKIDEYIRVREQGLSWKEVNLSRSKR